MQDTLFSLQLVREFFDVSWFAPYHDHFGTEVFVKVDMGRRHHRTGKVVLLVRELRRQSLSVVIVHH